MSPTIQNRNAPSKDCTVSGCGGRMTFQRSPEASGARNQEGSSGAWVCDDNPAHVEFVTPGEEQSSSGR